jgi:hypothetical protein
MAVVFDIGANLAGFQRGLDQTIALSRRAAGSIDRAFSGLASLANPLAALGGALAVGGFATAIQSALTFGETIHDMSKRTGVGAEALQELQHAARLSGVEMGELEKGLKFLNQHLGEAGAGNAQAIRLFQDLGISIFDAHGRLRDAGSVIDDVADRFAAMTNHADKVRLATEAFGRSGTLLIPMLEGGRAGLQAFRDEAQRLGLVLDRDMVEQAEKTKDSLDKLATVVKVNLSRAIIALGPHIEAAVEAMATFGAKMSSALSGMAPARLASIAELESRLARLDTTIKNLKSELAGETLGAKLNALFPGHTATVQAGLDAAIAKQKQLLDLIAGKSAAAAIKAGTAAISAEQLQALDKLKQKVIDAAIPDAVAQSIVKFREEVEKLATTIPSKAEEIRALGTAFEEIRTKAEEAKRAVTDAQAASAFQALGGGETSIFHGFAEIQKVTEETGKFRDAIGQAAKQGVPARDLFDTIAKGAANFEAKLELLRQRFADQPAVLERMKTAFAGLEFGGLARSLDAVVREAQKLPAATVTFIDTAEGINSTFIPALNNAGAAFDALGQEATRALRDDMKIAVTASDESLFLLRRALSLTQQSVFDTIVLVNQLNTALLSPVGGR